MESSFQFCPVCKKHYNLSTREPLNLPCCGDGICRECQSLIISPQESKYKCPQCGEEESSDAKFRPNIPIKRFLEKSQSLSIYCEVHKELQADIYCETHKKLICNECIIQHADHSNKFKKINRKDVEDYCKTVLAKLKDENQKIVSMIDQVNSYLDQENIFASDQFMLLTTHIFSTLAPQAQNEDDKNNLNFLAYHQQIQQVPQAHQPENNAQLISDAYSIQTFKLNQEEQTLLKQWIGKENIKLKLLYRASRDGFKALDFHSRCDNQGPMLTIIKSEFDKVFGAYTSISWQSLVHNTAADDGAFILSLTNKTKHIQYQNKDNAVVYAKDYQIILGAGRDIAIYDNCNNTASNYCILGSTYQLPNGFQVNTQQSNDYLAGKLNFKVAEIEVYKVE